MEQFAHRRRKLLDQLPKGSAALLLAAPEQRRSADVYHRYRPSSDFYYLTGCAEPHAAALFMPGHKEGEFTLFVKVPDEHTALWHGPQLGIEGAKQTLGAEQAFDIARLNQELPGLLSECAKLYYEGDSPLIDEFVKQSALETDDVLPFIHQLRQVKDDGEIASIRRAVGVSVSAHLRAMKACRPGLAEYHLEAELLHEFISKGCQSPAYPPIVAAGENGCVLHYTSNQDELREGELVLIDAAAESGFYAADITRTYPINGTFTREQKAIYELVLAAQEAAIAVVKPGVEWAALNKVAVEHITRGLVELGLLKGETEELIREEAYRNFFMHGLGHWLGLDVHDVGGYEEGKGSCKLEPGMVFTVEPGIYIRPDDSIDKKWWGIAVRIEDNVLVTQDGYDVLSSALPKTVKELEALVGQL